MSEKKQLVVNLFGGPCAHKSTICAGVYYELSCLGILAEQIPEYAKQETWLGNKRTLEHQAYVMAKQMHRQYGPSGFVDVMVTDGPFLMALYYGNVETNDPFTQFALSTFNKYDNMNFLLKREAGTPYQEKGRYQKEDVADQVAMGIESLLDSLQVPYQMLEGSSKANVAVIVEQVLKRL